jgi:hypothetical protein
MTRAMLVGVKPRAEWLQAERLRSTRTRPVSAS